MDDAVVDLLPGVSPVTEGALDSPRACRWGSCLRSWSSLSVVSRSGGKPPLGSQSTGFQDHSSDLVRVVLQTEPPAASIPQDMHQRGMVALPVLEWSFCPSLEGVEINVHSIIPLCVPSLSAFFSISGGEIIFLTVSAIMATGSRTTQEKDTILSPGRRGSPDGSQTGATC